MHPDALSLAHDADRVAATAIRADDDPVLLQQLLRREVDDPHFELVRRKSQQDTSLQIEQPGSLGVSQTQRRQFSLGLAHPEV